MLYAIQLGLVYGHRQAYCHVLCWSIRKFYRCYGRKWWIDQLSPSDFLGLPPQAAIATHKFGSAGLKIGAATKFWKTNQIQWSSFVPFSILGFVAALAGAQILLTIDKDLLSHIVALLLLTVLPIIFLKKDAGIVHHTASALKRAFGYLFYFLAQVFGAFFGGGAATIAFYVLMTFLGGTFGAHQL